MFLLKPSMFGLHHCAAFVLPSSRLYRKSIRCVCSTKVFYGLKMHVCGAGGTSRGLKDPYGPCGTCDEVGSCHCRD